MAHAVLIIDPDHERRVACASLVKELLAQLPGSVAGEIHAGNATCLWAAGPRAPIDVVTSDSGFAILIGYAVDDDGTWIGASRIESQLRVPKGTFEAYDGYYIGIAYSEQSGCAVRVDPLGLFPLHYAAPCAGTLMAATTPAAFACHPRFDWRVDRLGLAGILLANGILRNRPLRAGTKRLAMGHQLRWSVSDGVHEAEVFRLKAVSYSQGERFDDMCDRIGEELMRTIRRHRPDGDDTLLMLSGGLDSRLVAACLAEEGIPSRAVTLGLHTDYEVRAAAAVAERLALPIETVAHEAAPADFVTASRRTGHFSQLSTALSNDALAGGLAGASTHARFCWSGIPFDWLFEPVSRHSGFDIERGTWSRDELVAHVNAWGIPLQRLPALLGDDGSEACRQVIREIDECCTSGPYPIDRQSALFRWEQRVRGHLAASLHQISFKVWPLMIATDRRFFSAAYWLPHHAYPERRLEKAIMVRRRPDLAHIPLDTNSFAFDPVVGEARGTARAIVQSMVRRLRRAVQPFAPSLDNRRYERLFNVDHPRWVAVRQDAEGLRPNVEALLARSVLSGIWPCPRRRLRSRKPIEGGAAIRLLVGLAYALHR